MARDTELKLTKWYDDNIDDGYPGKYTVSVGELLEEEICDCISPSDIFGVGSCYDTALENYIAQFNAYLERLINFRDTILTTKRAYSEAVEVDYTGNLI